MSYQVKLYAFGEVSLAERESAVQRFRQALDAALGDASLVLPVHAAYQRIVASFGEFPAEDALSPGEQMVFDQWQAAEKAALAAALGSDRYMGDAEFEITA